MLQEVIHLRHMALLKDLSGLGFRGEELIVAGLALLDALELDYELSLRGGLETLTL